jgi:hypothetical protein
MMRAVQHDERGGRNYYEWTCVQVEKGEGGSWAVPFSSYVSGSEVLKNELLVGCALICLSEPNTPALFSDVDQMIFAYYSRETAVQKRVRRVGRV